MTDIYLALLNPPPTSTDLEAAATVVARGSLDPRILTQGTIAYLFTFDSGYRLMWLDSGGPITPTLQAAMETIKSTNLAIVGYNVQAFPRFQVPVTVQLVELFNPDLFFPAHHDELLSSLDGKSLLALPDMATEPLFLAIRDLLPKTCSICRTRSRQASPGLSNRLSDRPRSNGLGESAPIASTPTICSTRPAFRLYVDARRCRQGARIS